MNGNSNRIAVLFFLCYDGHMDEPGDLPALPEKEQIGMDKGVPMVDYGLKDRVVIITGANNPQGIGAATACAFAREGAKVALVYKKILRAYDSNKTGENGADRYFAANAGSGHC